MEFALTNIEFAYASSSRSVSPSRSGSFSAALLGRLPPNLAVPASMAASMAASIFASVALSDFGIIRLTEYFGLDPWMDLASNRFAYDRRTSPVMTRVGFFTDIASYLSVYFLVFFI